MLGKLLDLTDDLVFQELFGKQKNKEITMVELYKKSWK